MAQPPQDFGGEQSSPVKAESDGLSRKVICRGYCGFLGWTVVNHGRVTHKQSCPHRTEPWCQSHPKGCPSECVAIGAVERTAHTSGSAADQELARLNELAETLHDKRPPLLLRRTAENPDGGLVTADEQPHYLNCRGCAMLDALVGVREQLRQAEQKVEEGARQKPREEGESDGLDRTEFRCLDGFATWTLEGRLPAGARCPNCHTLVVGEPYTSGGSAASPELAREHETCVPNAIWQKTATDLLGAVIEKQDALDELAALRVERDAAVEALKWVDAGFEMPSALQPGTPDLKPLTVSVTRTAAGWRKGRTLIHEALAAGSYTEGGTQARTDLGGGQSPPRGARADV